MSASSITVQWDRIPWNLNNRISGYNVMYLMWQSQEVKYLQVGIFLRKATLTNLEEGTRYIIQVAGRTDEGVGTYSQPLEVQTKQGTQRKSKTI